MGSGSQVCPNKVTFFQISGVNFNNMFTLSLGWGMCVVLGQPAAVKNVAVLKINKKWDMLSVCYILHKKRKV